MHALSSRDIWSCVSWNVSVIGMHTVLSRRIQHEDWLVDAMQTMRRRNLLNRSSISQLHRLLGRLIQSSLGLHQLCTMRSRILLRHRWRVGLHSVPNWNL